LSRAAVAGRANGAGAGAAAPGASCGVCVTVTDGSEAAGEAAAIGCGTCTGGSIGAGIAAGVMGAASWAKMEPAEKIAMAQREGRRWTMIVGFRFEVLGNLTEHDAGQCLMRIEK
jgi:hypothetical protein